MKLNNKHKGILATLLFHGGLLLLLIFLGFTTPLPLPGEEGVEVSLGNSDEGMGDIQPVKTTAPEKATPPPPEPEPQQEEISTQDIEPAPVFEKPKQKKPKEKTVKKTVEKPEKKEVVREEPKVNPAALYKGKSKTSDNQSGEGTTGKNGDQGKPHGSMDSKSYTGLGGMGNGLSFSLKGREPKYLPKPNRKFTEDGTIVVQIIVDKWGKVKKAIAIDKGSNTTNSALRKMAEEAAKKAVFNANPDAPEMQKGTITYHFVVKK